VYTVQWALATEELGKRNRCEPWLEGQNLETFFFLVDSFRDQESVIIQPLYDMIRVRVS
jgi:hypothetical protein